MKKLYNKPKTSIEIIELHCILSGSGYPEVNVYNDEKYSPDNAFSRGYSGVWDENDEE